MAGVYTEKDMEDVFADVLPALFRHELRVVIDGTLFGEYREEEGAYEYGCVGVAVREGGRCGGGK